ncbi:dermonecrotic toxin SpeSicTox-betaIB4-like [Rhipicephalus sanguineus]|uniref:dermonecrotic toxin SpeSicTox-betaIB4-like n=1 Tax=Rhipicephalus sanguineus TaxID=34632 RepID=UPI0018942EE6|nr:dermonecrotic toxin SpeSicTox-betaIB4-like [Rhipicephalus sanguineus]
MPTPMTGPGGQASWPDHGRPGKPGVDCDKLASASIGPRHFYVFGHMANSLEDVDNFVEQGANALEADLTFASDGTVEKFYHGGLCDCGRDCEKSAEANTYLSYLRDAVNEDGKFAGKLQLLYIDTKTAWLSPGMKYQTGINLANTLINQLWSNGTIPSERMLNVILSVSTTINKEVLSGALDTFKRATTTSLFLDHVGFDISGYELLSIIANTYEDLGIKEHRWQGDGANNCLIGGYGEARTKAMTSRRTAANTTEDYVDKAYVWTVDSSKSVRRFLRWNIDGMATNVPTTILNVLKEGEFLKMYRLATAQDSPWTRIV